MSHHPPYRGFLYKDNSKTDGFGHYHPSGTVEEVTADLPHRAEQLGAKYGELFRLDKDGNPEKKPFVTFTPKATATTAAAAKKADTDKEAPSGPRWRSRFYKDSSKGDLIGTCYPSGDDTVVKADLAHRAQAIGAGYGEVYQLDDDGKEGDAPHATFGGKDESSDSSPATARRGRKPISSAAQPATEPAADEGASAAEKPSSSSQSTTAPKKPGRKPSTPPEAPKKRGRKPSNPPKK